MRDFILVLFACAMLMAALPSMATCEHCTGAYHNYFCDDVSSGSGWEDCNDYMGVCEGGTESCQVGGGGNCTEGGICEENQTYALPEVPEGDFMVIEPAAACVSFCVTIEA